MTLAVRWAEPGDAADLAAIVREIAIHYRSAEIPVDRSETIAAQWLAASPQRRFALAYQGKEAAGLASVSAAYPGGDMQGLLFLKELFVRDGFRGQQVGEALVGFLAEYCLAEGFGRIDLTTENWNEGALRFYDRLGAARQDQKVFLRFDRESLKALAVKGSR